jgi:hypothetical protein
MAKRFADEHGEPGVECATGANAQQTRCLVTVEKTPSYPEVEWGIVIGDAVHCLRSALDQVISALCTEPPSRYTGFPICSKEKSWVIDSPGQLWSLPERYVAVIQAAQPYHRGHKAHMHPLAVLHELWNLDKHRAIPATALVPTRIKVAIDEERTVGLASWTKFKTHPGRPLKKGTVLADCGYTIAPGVTQANVYVNAHISLDVGFGALDKASSLTHKRVVKTFHDLLIPQVIDVIMALGQASIPPVKG